jgi:hypothetical protein
MPGAKSLDRVADLQRTNVRESAACAELRAL